MCATAIIDGRDYPTIGELRNRLGMSELPIGKDYPTFRRQRYDRTCLCPVDMAALAKLLRCRIEYDGNLHYFILLDDKRVGLARVNDDADPAAVAVPPRQFQL